MYDTIHLWISKEVAAKSNLGATIPYNLTEITNQGYNYRTEQEFTSGKLGNCKVSISESGVSIKGSLAKFYLDDNLQILTRQDTARAIELLSDTLELPMQKAKVNRLDIGYNFKTTYPVESYYNSLGDARHYKRLLQPQSINYTNQSRQLIFYNKIAEAKSAGVVIPPIYQNSNLLRYELRFLKGVPKQFQQEVTAQTLYNEEFYIKVIDKWHSNYQKINKIYSVTDIMKSIETIKSPKDYIYHLTLLGLFSKGLNQAIEEVELLRKLNAFDKPEYYSRLKKDLKNLAQSPIHTSTSEHIEELDKKVKRVTNHYR